MSAARCKYEQGPCTWPQEARRHFKCQDGSCPVQAAGALPIVVEKPTTKPSVSEPEREVENEEEVKPAMRTGRGVPMEVGQCIHCGEKGVKLKVSDTFFGGGKGCPKCYKRAQNAAGRARAAEGKKEAKKSQPKPSAKAPIVKQLVEIGRDLGGAAVEAVMHSKKPATEVRSNGRAVAITVMCYEVAHIRKVLDATDGMDVRLGLEG